MNKIALRIGIIGGVLFALGILTLINFAGTRSGIIGFTGLGLLAYIAILWNTFLFPGEKKWSQINIRASWLIFGLINIAYAVIAILGINPHDYEGCSLFCSLGAGWVFVVGLAVFIIAIHNVSVYLLNRSYHKTSLFIFLLILIFILPILPALPDFINHSPYSPLRY